MKRPHKFRSVTNGTGSYDWAIYCEHCGLVVFHANRSGDRDSQYEISKKGCPLAPEPDRITHDPWTRPSPRFDSAFAAERKANENDS